jgi:hypothetical protein
MLIQTLCMALAKRVGALLLGAVILWEVSVHCGATQGRAIVHVSTPQVEVAVDSARYRIETLWETPIVCDLRPGRHSVRMFRSGRVVYEEEFTIAAGQEVILTAWDGYNDGRSAEQADGHLPSPKPEHARRGPEGSASVAQFPISPILN